MTQHIATPSRTGFLRFSATACLAILLGACGGGSGSAGGKVGVFPGFGGNLSYEGQGGDGGDGGVGGGADGEGGIGAGGSLGRFRGAEAVVFLENGTELGRTIVDENTGLFSIYPGPNYRGSLLIEIHGRSGAEYFDESRKAFVPFGAGEVLRARVPRVTGNIGITPLTEAAVAYQLANPGTGGQTVAERIDTANKRVQSRFNQRLPSGYKLADVTRLPTLIGPGSGPGAAGSDTAGTYAVVLAAIADLAHKHNPTLSRPALTFARDLGRDLTDGEIDGVAKGGEALGPAGETSYSAPLLAGKLVNSIDKANEDFSSPAASAPTPRTVQYGQFTVGNELYKARLAADGQGLISQRLGVNEYGTETALFSGDAPGISGLFSGLDNFAQLNGMLIRDDEARFYGVGINAGPAFPLGATAPAQATEPVRIAAFDGFQAVAFGAEHQVALRQNGSVVAWGSNSQGQLNDGSSQGTAAFLPVSLPLPATMVGATSDVSLALLTDGSIITWGGNSRGALGHGLTTAPNENVRQFVAPSRVVYSVAGGSSLGPKTDFVAFITCFSTTIAIDRDGKVWAWGDNSLGLLGIEDTSTFRSTAVQVPTLAGRFRKLVSGYDGIYALADDDQVWYWGLDQNQAVVTPRLVGNLPAIRDIMGNDSDGISAQDSGGEELILRYGVRTN